MKYLAIPRPDNSVTLIKRALGTPADIPLTDQEEIINDLYYKLHKLMVVANGVTACHRAKMPISKTKLDNLSNLCCEIWEFLRNSYEVED